MPYNVSMLVVKCAPWTLGLVGVALCSGCAKAAEAPADTSSTEVRAVSIPIPKRGPQGVLGPGVPSFWIRPGYKCELVAANFGEARFMALGDDGTLYVSQPGPGTIATLRLKEGKYVRVGDFIRGKATVHGLCWRDGCLWFTQSGAIYKAHGADENGEARDVQAVIPDGQLPKGGHWWRSILVDEKGFYTSIGDSGNMTDETKTDRQKIWRYSLDGTGKTLFASGLRNTEKLLYRPGTDEVWGMDHGSDWYGKEYGDREGRQPITDEVPGEKFNHYVQGGFYGHPFFVGGRYPRPEYANRADLIEWAEKTVMPSLSFGAHWAPNGWCFYTGDAIPDAKGDAFMTFHGSWNRKHKDGYRIDRTLFDKVTGLPFGHYMVIGCLSESEEVLARPVDIIQATDGSLLWSEDKSHRIYRLTYVGTK